MNTQPVAGIRISIWGKRLPDDLEDCLWEGTLTEVPNIGSILFLDDLEFQVEGACLDDEASEPIFLVDVVPNTNADIPTLILI